MVTVAKPVKLQVNTSGAWKDVLRFDAANDADSDRVIEAADALGKVGDVTFRICTDDGLQQVLMHWSKAAGWKDWKR